MAAHIVIGNIKGGHTVLDTGFSSSSLAHGTVYTVTSVTKRYLTIISDEKCYVAFTTDGTDPNTAADPRFLLPAGVLVPFIVKSGTKIKTLAI